MDLTINYDHTKSTNSERIGVRPERWVEINNLCNTTMSNEYLKTKSECIEWVISKLKDVTPADLVIVGYMFG